MTDELDKTIPPQRAGDNDYLRQMETEEAQTMAPRRERKTDGRFAVGDLIMGRYKVLAELGQGGMGVVYKCFDETAGIEVALKALPPELSHNSLEMEDIKDNFQLVHNLHHPNIASSNNLERNPENGNYYLIMECCEGEDLRRWIKRKRKDNPLTLNDVLPIIQQVADALDYAHAQKIMHRDIKPGNIMIDGVGNVKVLDFGLAAQIHTSMTRVSMAYHGTSGTGPYMAPEQWRGRAQGAAADQYALAVMAYEMLAGRLPFESTDPAVLKQAVLDEMPDEIPDLPSAAQDALKRAMSKEAADRFNSCADFAAALGGAKVGKAKKVSSGKSGGAWKWIAAVIVLALLAGAFFALNRTSATPTAPVPADTTADAEARKAAEQKAAEAEARAKAAAQKAAEAEARAKAAEEKALAEKKAAEEKALAEKKAAEEARLALERQEQERLEKERLEKERLEQERLERERIIKLAEDGKALYDKGQYAEAVKLLSEAAEKGNALAQNNLGWCYERGQGVKKDLDKASELYRKSAEQGYAKAQRNLGNCYANGRGVEKDQAKADEWYAKAIAQWRKAADAGDAEGQLQLGGCYYNGHGVEKDLVKAVQWFRKAAEQGDADAQNNLGACYHNGHGVEKDFAKAVQWFRKAAEQGYASAQYYLGVCYYNGQGVEKDLAKAVQWFRKAAEQGYAGAQYNLGVCYHDGQGVEKDLAKAVEWFRKAAEQGNMYAQYNLGWCYQYGQGVEKDYDEVVKWYRKAAEQGYASAQCNLGWCYENGQGVDKDLAKAVELYRKAAEQGNATAKENLRKLEEKIRQARIVKEEPKKTITIADGVSLTMIGVKPGSFMMGSENGDNDEKPVHQVTLTKPYYLGETEVTQAQWRAVMGTTVEEQRDKANTSWSLYGVGDNNPIYYVNWHEAMAFCQKLNDEGRAPKGWKFTLPTEAQWEFAARGGNKSKGYKYSGSNDVDDVAWYYGNSGRERLNDSAWSYDKMQSNALQTHAVRQKRANELGFYDMSGNVDEWCLDWYGSRSYNSGAVTDPQGPDSGSYRVLRGGGWCNSAQDCRSAGRIYYPPAGRFYNRGFRLALVPVQ